MVKKLSMGGAFLAGVFFCFAAFYLILFYYGHWQAPIFIYIATIPFSLLVNGMFDWLQSYFQMTHQLRSWLEAISSSGVGVVEFYLIGYLLERMVAKIKAVKETE
jgi:hypothetical protein